MKAPAATPANNKIKFKFNMRLHKTTGKALKAELAKATKAAKNIKKSIAKDGKKAKDPKKDDANDSKEDRNDAQGVLDSKVEDCIEKTLSNLSIDQV